MKSLKFITQYKGLPRELYIMFLSRIINSVCCFIGPLLTLILTVKIGFSSSIAGIYILLFGLISMPANIIGGKLADSFGRKKIFLITQISASLTFIFCSFITISASTIYILFIASFLSSLGYPSLYAISADLTTPENRTTASSLNYLGWNLGFAIAPAMAGLLFHKYLPLLFALDGLSSLISAIIFGIFIKETKGREDLKVTDKNRELEFAEEGSIFKILLKRKNLIIFPLIIILLDLGGQQLGFLLPIELSKVYGTLGAMHYGFLTSLNGFVVIIFTPILTHYLSKTKNIQNIFIGILFYIIALLSLSFFANNAFFIFAIFTSTLGEICLATNISTYMSNNIPESHRGRIGGLIPVFMNLGSFLSPPLVGFLLNYLNYFSIWFLAFILATLAALLIPIFHNKKWKII